MQCPVRCPTQLQIDICPCLRITFHQKQYPIKYFRSQQETLDHSAYRKAPKTRTGTFTHLCTVQLPLARVLILTRARLDTFTKTFQVENQLVFETSIETASSELFRKISSGLSRYKTELWLKNFFHDQFNFFIGDESSNWYQCHGWNSAARKPYNLITLHRDLGGDRRPSKGWEGNCHN